jgi:hypothetical protein
MIRPKWANTFTPRATIIRLSGDTPSLAETSPQLGRSSEPASGPLFWQGPLTMFGLCRKLIAAKVIRQHRETMKAFDARVEACRAKHQPIRHIEAERQDYMRRLLEGRSANA